MILQILLVTASALTFLILITGGWTIGTFNTFRGGQQDIKNQWSNIKTEYQRRADLFYNLVQSVKSMKNFEKETLIQVAQARGGNFGAGKMNEMKKLKGLDGIFSKLMVVFERYPKLQSGKEHLNLMKEIRITEDRINIARTDYNELVGAYNKKVLMFPSNILAGMFRFKEEVFFVNEEQTDKAPKIDLG